MTTGNMTAIAGFLIIFSSILLCTGQTFQYSRGWTNGKRSDVAPVGTNVLSSPTQNLVGGDNDKQTERFLIQQLLKCPCNTKIANLLANRNQLRIVNRDGDSDANPQYIFEQANDDETRFKRKVE